VRGELMERSYMETLALRYTDSLTYLFVSDSAASCCLDAAMHYAQEQMMMQ